MFTKIKWEFEDYYQYRDTEYILTLQISPDESMIAFGGNNNKLTFINLNTK